jgi:hypothetical protein
VAALRVTCPTCKTALQVGEEAQGKIVRCPNCQTALKIAGTTPPTPAPPANAPARDKPTTPVPQRLPSPASGGREPPVPGPTGGSRPPLAGGETAPKRVAARAPKGMTRPAAPKRPAAAPAPADDFVFERPATFSPRKKRQASSRGLVAVGCGALALLLLVGCAGGLYYAYQALLPGQPRQVAQAPTPDTGDARRAPPTRPADKGAAPAPPPSPQPTLQPPKALLGKWENVGEQDKGTLEFFADGRVAVVMAGAPEVKGTYRPLGDGVLEVKLPLPGGQTVTQKMKFQVTGDELVTTDERDKVDRFKRPSAVAVKPPRPAPAPPGEGVPEGWRAYAPKGAGFRLLVPPGPPPREKDEKGTGPFSDLTLHVTRFDAVNGNSAVVVVYADCPPEEVKGGPDAVLDGDKTGILLLPLGAKVGPKSKVTVSGRPGRDFDIQQLSGLPTRARVVLTGNRMVQVMAMGELAKDAAGKDLQTMFGSLRLSPDGATAGPPGPGPKPPPPAPERPADPAQDRAADLVVKRGGRFHRDMNAPGQPVVGAYLNLTGTTDADLKELATLKDLRQLHLNATRITDEGVKYLGGLKHLEKLDLSSNNLKGTTLKDLAGLTALRSLNLQGCPVDDDGVKALAALKGLQFLSLPQTLIGDDALKVVAGLKDLQTLELHTTGITDGGVKVLAGLSHLRDLDLRYTGVTDEGLKALAGLKGLKTLRLEKTKVTDAGVAALRKALPDCKVQR